MASCTLVLNVIKIPILNATPGSLELIADAHDLGFVVMDA